MNMEQNSIDFSEEMWVKDEIEVGPTLVQPRTICEDPTSKKTVHWEGDDIDFTKPISSEIIFEDDSSDDHDGETSDSELLATEDSKICSVKECSGNKTGSLEVEDLKPVYKEELSIWKPTVKIVEVSNDGMDQSRSKPEVCPSQPAIVEPEDPKAPFAPVIPKGGGPIGFPIIERPISEKTKRKKRSTTRQTQSKTCDQCGRDFETRGHLRSHRRSHTGERAYICTECGKTYSRLGHLKDHVKSHSGDKQFPCSICHMAFYRNVDLDRHFKTHTGEKPFQCEICSKSFVQKSNLNMHMKVHSGDRAHQCAVCLKKFMTNSKLRLHLNKHNKVKSKDVPLA